ncbi:MAG TPA: putative O-glycosylation ligase, exosortase A system-associated [Gammaproteobacteria bacterium]|nr:putative O-glycosylation ligase, exosortase A system-associated [Gammaproteobacteria bacterium]
MRDSIISLIVFGSIPFIFKRPYIGVYVWTWLAYMNPHRLSWGFAYNFPFAMIAGVTTIAATLFTRQKKSIPWSPLTVILLIWMLWLGVTTMFALNPEEAVPQWEKATKILLMTFIMMMVVRERMQVHYLVWVMVLSLGFYGFKGGLFTILTGGQYRIWGPPDSFAEDNNVLALALIMLMPLMRYLQMYSENVWLRRAITVGMVLCAFSIIASYSRGAFLAGSVMAFFLFIKSKQKLALGFAIAIVIAVLLAFIPEEWTERMQTIQTYEEDASAMGRINAWHFAYNLALDRPITGGGFEAFTRGLFYIYAPDPMDFHDAHSIYFEALGEQGFIGLFIFLCLGIAGLMTGSRVMRMARGDPELEWAGDLAAMTQVSLIGYAVGGLFLGLAYYDLPYNLYAIMAILLGICKEQQKKHAGQSA